MTKQSLTLIGSFGFHPQDDSNTCQIFLPNTRGFCDKMQGVNRGIV